jgi:hypothetical protein
MKIEDAHGANLKRFIDDSSKQTQNIISNIRTHAPHVADQLMVLDRQYHEVFERIERALREKTDRSEDELAQLAILEEFNSQTASHAVRTDVRVRLTRHGVTYGQGYSDQRGPLPASHYMTNKGQSAVVEWYASRTPEGELQINECLENNQVVVTELLSKSQVEFSVSELEFAQILIAEASRDCDGGSQWLGSRMCFTRSEFNDDRSAWPNIAATSSWAYFAFKYPQLFKARDAFFRIKEFKFQYTYPFFVGTRKNDKDSIFGVRVRDAAVFNSLDKRYALIFYNDSRRNVLIYEHQTNTIQTYKEEWFVKEYLKNTVPILKEPGREDGANKYNLNDTHPFTFSTVLPADIPENLKQRESIDACVKVTFDKPHLISSDMLWRCQHAYLYTREHESGANIVRWVEVYFESDLVEDVNLEQVLAL